MVDKPELTPAALAGLEAIYVLPDRIKTLVDQGLLGEATQALTVLASVSYGVAQITQATGLNRVKADVVPYEEYNIDAEPTEPEQGLAGFGKTGQYL